MFRWIKQFWNKAGPGIITGASDDDPSGIATYSQAGAAFGLKFLWTAWITYPLMYAIQEMSARIGIVNQTGLFGVISKHYHSFWSWFTLILIVPAILFNIAADLASMGAILHILLPAIPAVVLTLLIVLISMGYTFFCRYETVTSIFKVFCLALFCYFIVPFLVKQNWSEILYASFIPQMEWSKEYLLLLVAILGTTISPYLFFWQSSLSNEDSKKNNSSNKTDIKWMKLDVSLGMFASNLAMYFIILTTATVLHAHGVLKIQTVEEAAKALEPLAGKLAFIAFAVGVLGVGFLAIPVLAGCIGYMCAEFFHWESGLDKTPKQAPAFYTIIGASLFIALAINLIGIDPIESLVLTAVLYGLITPPIVLIILLISNNKKIMGPHVNSPFINLLGVLTFLLMTAASLAFLIFEFI